MTFRVIILPQAHRDIDRNADWWATHHSLEQALQWADTVYDQIATSTNAPESHGLSAENDEFPYEIRDILIGLGSRRSHRAIFTLIDNTVYVLAVRHGAQDRLHSSDIEPLPSP